jgi:hypothetical protein
MKEGAIRTLCEKVREGAGGVRSLFFLPFFFFDDECVLISSIRGTHPLSRIETGRCFCCPCWALYTCAASEGPSFPPPFSPFSQCL